MRAKRFLGEHPVVRAILGAAEPLARSGRAVAVVGERGTGKELFARHMHAAAGLSEEHFVRVDCAESSPDRLAHELFEREGGWRRAAAGTVLLDDLPSLPLDLQQRLLADLCRAHGVNGSARTPRLVASLTQEMTQECVVGHLDAALIAHLQPVEIVLPALRQRRCDIPLLVQHFLSLYAERHGVPPPAIETEALVQLWQYDWPGNVRELESLVERVVVLCRRGVIRSADLPSPLNPSVGVWTRGRRPANGMDSLQLRPTL
jgi:DNA-binding NtrC family response regulator